MDRVRTNDRSSRSRGRTGGPAFRSWTGSERRTRFAPSFASRSGGPGRPGGYDRRPAAAQGEFALPKTITPALPAIDALAERTIPVSCRPHSAHSARPRRCRSRA